MNPDLKKLHRSLPEITDYFSGVPQQLVAMPHNILVFSRTTEHRLKMDDVATHHRFMLVISLAGVGGVLINNSVRMLHPGHCTLICPFQAHKYADFSNDDYLWMFVTFEMTGQDFSALLRDKVFFFGDNELRELSALLRAYIEGDGNLTGARTAALLALLLRSAQTAGCVTSAQCLTDHIITEILGWIDAHIMENPKVEDVAKGVNISQSYLHKIFRAHTGLPIGTFLRRQSIYRSIALLRDRDMNVSQTAEACGYSSVFVFSRTFKTVMGCTPKDFIVKPPHNPN